MPKPPRSEPIGLQVSRTAKTLNQAFESALSDAGGSLPTWLILLSLKSRRWGNQRELAAAIGIQGATLTHHLDGLERDGLVTRRRDPGNRRMHVVELTEAGDALFHRLRKTAMSFDRRLRSGISEGDLADVSKLLDRLAQNAGDEPG
jgi:MarR family transcriptional regulator for hemolysin